MISQTSCKLIYYLVFSCTHGSPHSYTCPPAWWCLSRCPPCRPCCCSTGSSCLTQWCSKKHKIRFFLGVEIVRMHIPSSFLHIQPSRLHILSASFHLCNHNFHTLDTLKQVCMYTLTKNAYRQISLLQMRNL